VALSGLPAGYREDWGITIATETINLPSMYHPSDGRGAFIRATAGQDRAVGSVQDDGIINITGYVRLVSPMIKALSPRHYGALYQELNADNYGFQWATTTATYLAYIGFDASRDPNVKIADENRPLNVAMTPAVYLGV
jgi:hypothetical protein